MSPDTDSVASAIAYAEYRNKLDGLNAIPARLGKLNKETTFVLDYFKMEEPVLLEDGAGKKFILVDHNEKEQSVKNRDSGEILEIIDHHRVSDLTTPNPIFMRFEPVGCTATIIYKMFAGRGMEISKQTAGLMLSAIVSDTLIFKSPTCTREDKMAAQALSKIAGVDDLQTFAGEMLKAGSDLQGYSAEELLNLDRKKFRVAGIEAYISQIQTLDYDDIMRLKDEFIKEMDLFLEKTKAGLAVLMITDLNKNSSMLLFTGRRSEFASRVFNAKIDADHAYLEGVVSRKAQIIPRLMAFHQGE